MTREQWLELRKQGIGGSEAAAIFGLNPYKTNIELWEEKTGRRTQEDIGHKLVVQYGNNAESHLRELFALDYPQYEVKYEEFKIFKNSEYPFMFATLDGWLEDKIPNPKYRCGVLEIKTTEIMHGTQILKWKNKIPDNYYIQCLHQLLATGYDFVVLKAQIKFNFGDSLRLETKHYHIERSEVEEDLAYLKAKEIEFWTKYVMQDIRPNLLLPAI
jgi:putative phage-type endonuclease